MDVGAGIDAGTGGAIDGSGIGEGPVAVSGGRWAMIAALITLNLLDVVTTKLILLAGGSEVNPLMRNLVHDPVGAFAVKLAIVLGVGVLLLRSPVTSKLADRAVLVAVGAYTLVIGWNTGLLIAAVRAGRFA